MGSCTSLPQRNKVEPDTIYEPPSIQTHVRPAAPSPVMGRPGGSGEGDDGDDNPPQAVHRRPGGNKQPTLKLLRAPLNKKRNGPNGSCEEVFSVSMLDAKTHARLRSTFNLFDKDRSGAISERELIQVRTVLRGCHPLSVALEHPACVL